MKLDFFGFRLFGGTDFVEGLISNSQLLISNLFPSGFNVDLGPQCGGSRFGGCRGDNARLAPLTMKLLG